MMREIRDELSRRYIEDPSAEGRDLQEIRKRYGIKGWEWEGVLLMMERIWIRAFHFAKTQSGVWASGVIEALYTTPL